jgi:drug/metabolite transporter (DMT)-like permease
LGIVLMTRPGGESFQPAALVAGSAALFSALVVIIIKKLARTEETLAIMFHYTLWSSLLSLVPALIFWQTPDRKEFTMLVLVGILGVTGQTLATHGFSLGEATAVVPFDYLRLVYATLYGLFLFAEIPGIWSLLGSLLIIASNFYILFLKGDSRVIS